MAKLPVVQAGLASMVTSSQHPSVRRPAPAPPAPPHQSRKRPTQPAAGNSQRTNSKKCPRFVSSDQRKVQPANKTLPRTKELLLHPNLFNSFRITKPSKPRPNSSKCDSSSNTESSPVSFDTKRFYKFSESIATPPVVTTQSIPPSQPAKTEQNGSTRTLKQSPASDSTVISTAVPPTDGSQLTVQVKDALVVGRGAPPQHPAPPGVFAFPRLRFPAAEASSSAIVCKWEGCQTGFKTHGQLSDHIKVRQTYK